MLALNVACVSGYRVRTLLGMRWIQVMMGKRGCSQRRSRTRSRNRSRYDSRGMQSCVREQLLLRLMWLLRRCVENGELRKHVHIRLEIV